MWRQSGDIARGALAGAFLGLIGSKVVAAFAGLTLSDAVAYPVMVVGAIGGAIIMWRAPPGARVPSLPTEPTPALVELMQVHRDWQDDKLRQAIEPHAIRLGISTDVLISTYSEINAEMKRVGAA